MTLRPTGERRGLSSVQNALKLRLLLRNGQAVGVSEAARSLGVGRSTAHRLLTTLQGSGFVEQNARTRAYHPGPALLELGLSAVRHLEIRSVARARLEELTEAVGETTHLMLRRGATVLVLDSVESQQPLRTTSRVGVSLPAHCVSGGKALLALLTLPELRALYPSSRLVRSTPRTLATRRALETELELVRKHGYATSLGESEPDIGAVGAAIVLPDQPPLFALAVSGPLQRVTENLDRLARETRAAAAAIAESLRPRAPTPGAR